MDDQPRPVEDSVVTLLDMNAQGEALNPAWGKLQLSNSALQKYKSITGGNDFKFP